MELENVSKPIGSLFETLNFHEPIGMFNSTIFFFDKYWHSANNT